MMITGILRNSFPWVVLLKFYDKVRRLGGRLIIISLQIKFQRVLREGWGGMRRPIFILKECACVVPASCMLRFTLDGLLVMDAWKKTRENVLRDLRV